MSLPSLYEWKKKYSSENAIESNPKLPASSIQKQDKVFVTKISSSDIPLLQKETIKMECHGGGWQIKIYCSELAKDFLREVTG